jgi:hypothetical protein
MVVPKPWVEGECNLKLVAIFALAVICFIAGCRHEFTSADLAGTYVASYSFGTEELRLASNGTYVQTFTPAEKSLKSASTSGKWAIKGDQLQLFDSLLIHDQYGDLSSDYAEKKSGVNIMRVSSSFGKTTIHISANTDVEYVKRES